MMDEDYYVIQIPKSLSLFNEPVYKAYVYGPFNLADAVRDYDNRVGMYDGTFNIHITKVVK